MSGREWETTTSFKALHEKRQMRHRQRTFIDSALILLTTIAAGAVLKMATSHHLTAQTPHDPGQGTLTQLGFVYPEPVISIEGPSVTLPTGQAIAILGLGCDDRTGITMLQIRPSGWISAFGVALNATTDASKIPVIDNCAP